MQISIDEESLKIRTAAGSPLSKLTAKRRDKFPLGVRFSGGERASGATGRVMLKAAGDFAGEAKAEALEWSKTGTGSNAVYTFVLNLNVARVNALFAAVNGVEPERAVLRLELTWNEGDYWRTVQDIEFEILNDYIVGDEGVPDDEEDPPYPAPSEILVQSDIGDSVASQAAVEAAQATADAAMLALENGAETVAWDNVTGKPSTFPPTIGSGAGDAVAGDDARLADAQALLASHFKTSSENLFISISEDGVNWREQLASYTPLIAGVRDPSMIFWDGAYYLAHTVNGFSPPETRFALAKSVDGINWSHLRYVDLSGITGGPEFVWAPELRIIENRVVCLVAVSVDSGSTFQTYLIDGWGRDLATNGVPQLLVGLAANAIDATVIKEGDTFYLFYKNEAEEEKVIEVATSESLAGPYTIERSGDWAGWGTDVEGPNIVRLPNGKFRIYIDASWEVKYSDSATEDLFGSWSSPVSISGIACRHPAMIPKPESYVPDVGLGVRTGNFTARIGGRYIARGNLTVTDPTGTSAGQEYAVVVGSGTCTIGGVGFSPSRFPILRQYNGSSWETLAQTLVGNLTLGSSSGNAHTINGGITAAHATALGSTNVANVGALDGIYRRTAQDLLGFSYFHRGQGFSLTTSGTMGTSSSYSTGEGRYASAAGSNVGDFTTDIGNFNIGGGGAAVTFFRAANHIFSWNVGASANNSATSIIFMVGGNATSLSGKDPTTRSFGVTITDAVTAGQTQYILWTHDGTSLVGNSTVSLASPRLWADGGRMSLVYQWNGGTPTLRLFLSRPGIAPVLITSLSGAAANWGGDITLGNNRNFVVRHYVNTAGVVNFWFMSDLRWISEPTTIP